MDLAIESVHDIIRIINAYPQWRQEIRDSLFPDIDFPKAFRELAEAQRRTEQSVQELSQTVRELAKTQKEMAEENRKSQLLLKHHTTQIARLNSKMVEAARERQVMKEDLAELKQGQKELRGDVDYLRRNQNDLRGRTYEQQIRNRANAVFGYFLKRGHNARNEIGDYLEEAEENAQLSELEHERVLACDLLWAGKLKRSKEALFLVVEVSWSAEETDIERAAKRAQILRSIGLKALGVVAGIQWAPEVAEQALFEGVVVVNDMRLDKDSWQAALALVV